jgi:D-glycero-D-manno-heptose 1,7-bisphosphate phosphatase
MTAKRFAIFDRDGTLIVERNYLSDPAEVKLIPGAALALRRLMDMGIGLAIVTYQSGIGRGFFGEEQLHAVHRRMGELLAAEGVALPPIYWCPHRPEDDCTCRKPLPGLLERAGVELGFDPEECFVIGDNACDIELGQRVGAATILVRSGYGKQVSRLGNVSPDYVAADVAEASDLIIASFLQASGPAVRHATAVRLPSVRVA